MVYKLLKKGVSLALAFAVVLSLSCCGGGDEDIILPDIVFVICDYGYKRWDDAPYKIQGYYIDKNGEIKYFNITDDYEQRWPEFKITLDEYPDVRNIEELHKKITEAGVDTRLEPMPQEDLMNYYKSLMKINKKTKLEYWSNMTNTIVEFKFIYGVRINENNEEEYVLILEKGDGSYWSRDNSHVEKDLLRKLIDIFHYNDYQFDYDKNK
ncbi:MAG: hypothetical protein J1E40_06545 [Oscillospiraceae bacterium]|nr:hypothetical protein [Oscillospiraceae bacterium]